MVTTKLKDPLIVTLLLNSKDINNLVNCIQQKPFRPLTNWENVLLKTLQGYLKE